MLLVPLLTVVAPTGVEAQSSQSLVSNLGQSDGAVGASSVDHAQSFTTGGHVDGYTVTSVDIYFGEFRSSDFFSKSTITIRSDSGGAPGTVLATLTDPSYRALSADAVNFAVPGGGLALAPNTTYWVVIDFTAVLIEIVNGNTVFALGNTTSDDEDAGAASGWSIGDGSLFRTYTSDGDWTDFAESKKIGINGSPRVESVVADASRIDRTELEEGQTRRFYVDRVPRSFGRYWLRVEPVGGVFTAEADDFGVRARNRAVAPGSSLRMGLSFNSRRDERGFLSFEVTAASDNASDADETFGVKLCTTANCEGGAVLGSWTITIREPAADTTLTGTGASVTVSGGRTEMLEASGSRYADDSSDSVTVTLAAPPDNDIVVVGYTPDKLNVRTDADGDGTPEFDVMQRLVQPVWFVVYANDGTYTDIGGNTLTVTANSPENLSRTVEINANDNAVDIAGGVHTGRFVWRAFDWDVDAAVHPDLFSYIDNPSGHTAYTTVTVPDVPLRIIDNDATPVYIRPAATPDDTAFEGNTSDTAKFRVQTARALIAGETLTVPVRFVNAVQGTDFTVALDGSPTGVSYADAGTFGEVTFTGPADASATLVVTAIEDTDAVSERLVARLSGASDIVGPPFMRTNLVGGSCARLSCYTVDDTADNYQYRMLLADNDGVIIDLDGKDPSIAEAGGTLTYGVRLGRAPVSGETVTVAVASDATSAAVTAGSSLSFTDSNWQTPQNVTVTGQDDSADTADRVATISHSVTSSGGTSPVFTAGAGPDLDVSVVDDDATTVTLSGGGSVMVEGDASRVDTLTVTLSRALVDGEFVRVPLRVEAYPNGNRVPQPSGREPRISANVSWPPQFNDFDMTASGVGVSYRHVEVVTPSSVGFRVVTLAGAGAQTATVRMSSKAGFVDGDVANDSFGIKIWEDDVILADFVSSNLGGGLVPWRHKSQPDATRQFSITDSERTGSFGLGFSSVPSVVVPADWPLLPDGVGPGDSFRMVYVTSDATAAQVDEPEEYNDFVRESARSVAELAPYVSRFAAVASYAQQRSLGQLANNVQSKFAPRSSADQAHRRALLALNDGDARIRGAFVPPGTAYTITETAGSRTGFQIFRDVTRRDIGLSGSTFDVANVPFYWVGGDRVADDNADFTDGDWDSESAPRHADGTTATVNAAGYWTGSTDNGTIDAKTPSALDGYSCAASGRDDWLSMGSDQVRVGYLNAGSGNPLGPAVNADGATATDAACAGADPSEHRPMFALSGVFTVDAGVIVRAAEAAEGSNVEFEVTLPEPADGQVTVPYTLSDGRGVSTDATHSVATGSADGSSADFNNSSGNVVFANGERTKTITVATTDDNDYEGDHYFTVELGNPTGTNAPDRGNGYFRAQGTITDESDAPTFEFNPAAASVAEDAGSVTLTIERSKASGSVLAPSTVSYTTKDITGGAESGEDYIAAAGTVVFAASESSKMVSVDVVADDDSSEGDETFEVVLTAGDGAALGTADTATVTIADVGAVSDFEVSVAAASVAEGAVAMFAVTLSENATADVTVPYTLSDGRGMDSDPAYTVATGSADGTGADYTNTAGSVTITSGSRTATISVPTSQDSTFEGTHYFTVSLGTPTSSGTAPTVSATAGSAEGFIDDAADEPTVGFSTATVSAAENRSSAIVVTVVGGTEVPVTVDWATADGTATAGADYTVASGTLTFPAGDTSESITLAILDDNVAETRTETIDVTLSSPDGASIRTGFGTVEYQILDNDLGLALSAPAGDVAEAGGAKTITVTLGRRLSGTETVTVPLTVSGVAASGYTLALHPATQNGVSLLTGGSHSAQNPAVMFGAASTAATLRFTAAANTDRSQPAVVIDYGTGARAPSAANLTDSYELATPTGGPIGFVITDDETGDIVVPSGLVPSGVGAGEEFRLLWVTSESRDASATDIGTYDGFVRGSLARSGLAALKPYGGFARVLGSTASVNARDHTGTTFTSGGADEGVPIYWLSGAKVADHNEDIYDGTWAAQAHTDVRKDDGSNTGIPNNLVVWTGTASTGAAAGSRELGTARPQVGTFFSGNRLAGSDQLQGTSSRFYALSPVFKVEGTPTTNTASVADATAAEGSAVEFTVSLSQNATTDVTVPFTLGDGRGVSSDPAYSVATSADYTNTAGTITIASGSDTGTISVATTEDTTYEGPHYFTVTLGTPTQVSGTPPTVSSSAGTAVGTITDEADLPTVEFSQSTFSGTEADGEIVVTVSKSGSTLVPATVEWATRDINASAGQDYTAGSGTLSFAANSTSQTIRVVLLNDTMSETSERFEVDLSGPVHAKLGTSTSAAMTVLDNDVEGSMSVSAGSAAEMGGTVDVTIELSKRPPSTVRVALVVSGATVGEDYTVAVHSSSDAGVSLNTNNPHSAQRPEVRFANRAQTAVLRFTAVPNTDRTQPVVSVAYGTGFRAPHIGGTYQVGEFTGSPVSFVITDDETGAVEAPAALAPSGLHPGDEFRLLWVTSGSRDGSAADVGDYDDFAQGLAARSGLAALRPYAGFAAALVSTATDDARDHTATTFTAGGDDEGHPIYWLGGGQVAGHYEDFYDGVWDAQAAADARTEAGVNTGFSASTVILTGTAADGAEYAASGTNYGLGRTNVATAVLNNLNGTTATPLQTATAANTATGRVYVLSPVFTVAGVPAGVSVSPGTVSLTELHDTSGTATYEVVLDTDPGDGVTVTVTVASSDTTAVAVDTDPDTVGDQSTLTFTGGSGAVTDWDTAQEVTLRAVNDGDTVSESGITISHAAATTDTANPYHDVDGDAVTVGVTDAGHGVTVSETAVEVAANGTAAYEIVLDSDPGGTVVITPSVTGSHATVDGPFTFTSATWSTPQDVTVSGANSGAGTATVTHSVSGGTSTSYTSSTSIPDVAVTVSDDRPTVSLSVSNSGAVTEGGTLTVTATLSANASGAVTIPVRMRTSGSPTADGADFMLSNSGSITISSGANSATLTFTAVDDDIDEDTETLVLELGTLPSTHQSGSPSSVNITVTDNDTAGVSITKLAAGISVAENAGTDTYTVVLDSEPTHDVTVAITSGTPGAATLNKTGGTKGAMQTLTFTPSNWDDVQTVTVEGVNDDIDNAGDQRTSVLTHAITSTDAKYNAIADKTLTVTVTDHGDTAGVTITKLAAGISVAENAGTDTYTVVLDSEPTHDVTVAITSGTPGAATLNKTGGTFGAMQTLTFTPSNWDSAQTVTVRGENDHIVNPNRRRSSVLTHAFSSTDAKYNAIADKTLTVTVDDDDVPLLASFGAGSYAAGELASQRQVSVRVTLVPAPHAATTVTYRVAGSATPGSDYTALTGTVSVPTSGSADIAVSVLDDSAAEGAETITLTLIDGAGYDLAAARTTTTVTVIDDEETPCDDCVVVTGGSAVAEGDAVSFTVVAYPAPAAALSVGLHIFDSPGRPDFLSRHDHGDRWVTIPAGQQSHTFTVPTVDDSQDEADGHITAELRYVSGSHRNGYSIGTTGASARVDVSDDDPTVAPYRVPRANVDASLNSDSTMLVVTLSIDIGDPPAWPGDHVQRAHVGYKITSDRRGTLQESSRNLHPGDLSVGFLIKGLRAGEIITVSLKPSRLFFFRGRWDVPHYHLGSMTEQVVTVPGVWVNDDTDTDGDGLVPPTTNGDDETSTEDTGDGTGDPDPTPEPPLVKYAALVKSFYDRISDNNQHGDSAAGGWNKRFLKAMGHPEYLNYPQEAVTAARAQELYDHGGPGANTAWEGTVEALEYKIAYDAAQTTIDPVIPPPPDPEPVITISGGSAVTEGGTATFTITASPAPATPITVNIGVTQSGSWGASGAATVSVSGATTTYTIATSDDQTDESDGSVTATIQTGTGYTVGTASAATVTVADDDPPVVVDPTTGFVARVEQLRDGYSAYADWATGTWHQYMVHHSTGEILALLNSDSPAANSVSSQALFFRAIRAAQGANDTDAAALFAEIRDHYKIKRIG